MLKIHDAEGGTRTRTALRPTDFLTTTAFAANQLRISECGWRIRKHGPVFLIRHPKSAMGFVVWTMPSPCSARKALFRRGPSRLYTLPVPLTSRTGLSSALAAAARARLAFADFDPIRAGVSIRRAQLNKSVVSAIPPPRHPQAKITRAFGFNKSSQPARSGVRIVLSRSAMTLQ